MQRFTALIIDDEVIARRGIRVLLSKDNDVNVIGECKDGVEAIDAIQLRRPDIVFLDIEMPEVDGFDVVAALPSKHLPAIIFVTAYHQYAIEAFQLHAVDYIVKPVAPDRFRKALDHAKRIVKLQRTAEEHEKLLLSLQDIQIRQGGLERVVVRSHGRFVIIRTKNIDWIEAADDYVYVHVDRQRYLVRQTLTSLECTLDPHRFIRIHRSTIVNLDRIRQLHPQPHGDAILLLQDDTQVNVSRSYRQKIEQALSR